MDHDRGMKLTVTEEQDPIFPSAADVCAAASRSDGICLALHR